MKMIRQTMVGAAVMLLLAASVCHARLDYVGGDAGSSNPFTVEVNANDSVFEGRISKVLTQTNHVLSVGVNGIYNQDEFTLISGDLTLGNRFMDYDNISFAIGFRGIGGVVEAPEGWDNHYDPWDYRDDPPLDDDVSVGAAGFLFSTIIELIDFDLYYGGNAGLDLLGEICYSPSPMAFGDTDSYMEGRLALGVNILSNRRGAILVGYRYLKVDFEDDYKAFDLEDDGAYFGFRLTF